MKETSKKIISTLNKINPNTKGKINVTICLYSRQIHPDLPITIKLFDFELLTNKDLDKSISNSLSTNLEDFIDYIEVECSYYNKNNQLINTDLLEIGGEKFNT